MKSVLIDFIKTHENWQEELAAKNIFMHNKGDLWIFNYGAEADFHDPYVCEARGIIIDVKNLVVVCWPFRKFGNWDCDYADVIDWASADIQEKVDGSIVKYYSYNGEWHWATNGMIDAADASTIIGNFDKLIKSAKNFDQVAKEFTDPEYTYIFELTSPYNKVVVSYTAVELTIIGMRNNVTGQEETYRGSFKTPKRYSATNFDECITLLSKMNKNGIVENEGFVVVDKNYNRIKVKTEEYFEMHHKFNNGVSFSQKSILSAYFYRPNVLKELLMQYPEYQTIVDQYINKAETLITMITDELAKARALRATFATQKEFALAISKHPKVGLYFFAVTKPNATALDYINYQTKVQDESQIEFGCYNAFAEMFEMFGIE